MKKRTKNIFYIIFLISFIVVFFPYMKVEILTLIFSDNINVEIDGICAKISDCNNKYFKVIEKENKNILVLVISEFYAKEFKWDCKMSNILSFKKNIIGDWVFDEWERTIWSTCGSANDWFYPFYW